MVKSKKSTPSPSVVAKALLTFPKKIASSYAKSPVRNWSITAAVALACIEFILAFGSSATGVAESYKNAVNSHSPSSLSDAALFPHEDAALDLPAFLANSYAPFTITGFDVAPSADGKSATIEFDTKEGTSYKVAAEKSDFWAGPFWVSQWKITTDSPTVRVSVDPTLPETLDFTFGDMPFTTKDIAAMSSVDQSYAILPGVLSYGEPQFGFLSGGTQTVVYTTGAQRFTLGPDGENLSGDIVIQAEKNFKKSVIKCSKKRHCKALPKYKNKEFKVKKPAGTWDHLSTFDKYKIADCTISSTSFKSAVTATIGFECPAKVTRTFLWSDTYEQGFVWGWWYIYWYETAYKSKKDALKLTVSGESTITFDALRETYTPKMLNFTGAKN